MKKHTFNNIPYLSVRQTELEHVHGVCSGCIFNNNDNCPDSTYCVSVGHIYKVDYKTLRKQKIKKLFSE